MTRATPGLCTVTGVGGGDFHKSDFDGDVKSDFDGAGQVGLCVGDASGSDAKSDFDGVGDVKSDFDGDVKSDFDGDVKSVGCDEASDCSVTVGVTDGSSSSDCADDESEGTGGSISSVSLPSRAAATRA